MTALFISDLHLHADRPVAIEQFVGFLRNEAPSADAVYILGDLFEVWIGDDDTDHTHAPIIDALATLKRNGVPCHFMHGNRDFLVGRRFATATGCELLGEWELVDLYGERILLTHGDLLCTDDEPYMALRAMVREQAWQRDFLAKSLADRRAIAAELRERSRTETANKPADIMDVNQGAVEAAMRKHGVNILLHGHTHRPNVHEFELDGARATRIVLGDWFDSGSVVRWDKKGFSLDVLPR